MTAPVRAIALALSLLATACTLTVDLGGGDDPLPVVDGGPVIDAQGFADADPSDGGAIPDAGSIQDALPSADGADIQDAAGLR